MKFVATALGAALLICRAQTALAIPVDETAISSDAIAHERAALQAAIAESQKDNADSAALTASLKAILADPAFVALSDSEHHAAYLLYGAVLYDARDWMDARIPLNTASEMAEGGAFDWGLRLSNDFALHDYGDAVSAATKLARNWPDKLADYRDHAFVTIVQESQKPPGDLNTPAELLNTMFSAKWQPQNPFSYPDGLWMTLLRIRLDHGDLQGAKTVAAELKDPVALLEMRVDKRFDSVVQADPQHYDVMKAYAAELEQMKARSAAAPDKLEGTNATADVLYKLNRPQEALDLLVAGIARANSKPQPFSDYDDQINWSEDQRSRTLFKVGRSDEAFAALEKAAALKESGNAVNVSQAINLAGMYDMFDRPKDALAAVAVLDFSNASPYGRMALQDVRACAYFELSDTENLTKTLAYMKAHASDGMQLYLNTLLCTGDLDGTAAEIIAELRDPARRVDILYYLQDYLPEPNATKRENTMHAAWLAARGRADVAAEIAKVGRIESYAILAPTY